jgi:hypothetical protein
VITAARGACRALAFLTTLSVLRTVSRTTRTECPGPPHIRWNRSHQYRPHFPHGSRRCRQCTVKQHLTDTRESDNETVANGCPSGGGGGGDSGPGWDVLGLTTQRVPSFNGQLSGSFRGRYGSPKRGVTAIAINITSGNRVHLLMFNLLARSL